jgi:hypothetical protein
MSTLPVRAAVHCVGWSAIVTGPAAVSSLLASVCRRAAPVVCLLAFVSAPAVAQSPAEPGFGDLPVLRGTADMPAASRLFKPPVYGDPVAFGAGATGFDSRNRRRQIKKLYPGAPRPVSQTQRAQQSAPNNATPIALPPPQIFAPSVLANKPPIAAALAGTVPGQPQRRRLKADTDPFGPVGDYVGSFLVKSALEVSGGYDSNPGRFNTARGSGFYVIAPELLVASDWSRHSVVADLRGSFTGYGHTFAPDGATGPVSPVPFVIDRPDFTGKISGRLDVTRETRVISEVRLRVATDNPGSPNVQAGLQRYPIYSGLGGTFGVEQDFNRLTLIANATIDRLEYQNSSLTNGASASNEDRNYNQYGGLVRASYEIMPGLKPFVEGGGDSRQRDLTFDRSGFQRDSTGSYVKGGTTFELTRLITGEASIGYGERMYTDTRLNRLEGLLTSASLVWAMTPLTTVKFISTSSLDETTLSGASGVLVRTYTAEVDHDFRRWLTGIGRFTYGTLDYQGGNRLDEFFSVSGDLIYRLDRNWQIKAQIRHDKLQSSIPGFSSASTSGMLGVRWQN